MTTENFEDEYKYDEPTIKVDGIDYIPNWMIPNELEIYDDYTFLTYTAKNLTDLWY
jgi:hypothetical protein